MNNFARSYSVVGRFADALKLLEEALAMWKAKLGPDHPETLMAMNNLAKGYDEVDRMPMRSSSTSRRCRCERPGWGPTTPTRWRR